MTILYTSLAEIKSFDPCPKGWKDILRGQGKTHEDDVLFPLIDCLNSNDFFDVCWLLRQRKTEFDILAKTAMKIASSVAYIKNIDADWVRRFVDTAKNSRDTVTTFANVCEAIHINSIRAVEREAYHSDLYYTRAKQIELNIQFLQESIREHEANH